MPIHIPLQVDIFNNNNDQSDENHSNVRIFNAIKEKSNSNHNSNSNETTTNLTLNETNLDTSSSFHFFESQVKLDVYKTIYDYFFYTVLNKYFLFYFDPNEASNERECQSINFKTLKAKPNFNFFKLSELNSNEQYKSILNMKCFKFVSVDFLMND